MMTLKPVLLEAPTDFNIVDTTLQVPYTEDERKHLMQLFDKVFGEGLEYDDDVFRLEGMEDGKMSMSIVKYSDLLLIDVVASRIREWRAGTKGDVTAEKLVNYIANNVAINDKPLNKYRSNVIAMSVIVTDSEGKVLTTQRSGDVVIGKNISSVSTTGTPNLKDFGVEGKFGCAKRKLKADLNVDISKCTFKYTGVFVGANKKQPVILVNCFYDGDIDEIIGKAQLAEDYHKKIKYASVHKLATASMVLTTGGATEAARYHMYNTVANILGGNY